MHSCPCVHTLVHECGVLEEPRKEYSVAVHCEFRVQQSLPLSHFVTFNESRAPLFSCVLNKDTYLAAQENSSASAVLTNPNPCSQFSALGS